MTRFADGSGLATESSSDNTTITHLIEISFYDTDTSSVDVTRITTAVDNIQTSGLSGIPDSSWEAIGLPGEEGSVMSIQPATETDDARAQGLELQLDAVDPTFTSELGNKFFRGQPIKIWRLWIDESAGTISEHLQLWDGLQNEAYEIEEDYEAEPTTATIRTRTVSRLARLQTTKAILTNEESYNSYLNRIGLSTGDTFFQNVSEIQDKPVFWGRDKPQNADGSDSGYGGSGGPDRPAGPTSDLPF